VGTSYLYNTEGTVSSETKTISGTSYTTGYTYDRQGNMLSVTHPNNTATAYLYNTQGLVDEITQDGSLLVEFDYGPHGKITNQDHINGVDTVYDLNQRKSTNMMICIGLYLRHQQQH